MPFPVVRFSLPHDIFLYGPPDHTLYFQLIKIVNLFRIIHASSLFSFFSFSLEELLRAFFVLGVGNDNTDEYGLNGPVKEVAFVHYNWAAQSLNEA